MKKQNDINILEKEIETLRQNHSDLREEYERQIISRDQELRTKTDKLLQNTRQLEQGKKEYEEMKERVRRDIQKIRVKEKELEARLEIVKRDSETLLAAKDKKLLDFRQKIDSLQYEIDHLKENEKKLQEIIHFWKERMERAQKAMHLAASLLDVQNSHPESENMENKEDQNFQTGEETTAAHNIHIKKKAG